MQRYFSLCVLHFAFAIPCFSVVSVAENETPCKFGMAGLSCRLFIGPKFAIINVLVLKIMVMLLEVKGKEMPRLLVCAAMLFFLPGMTVFAPAKEPIRLIFDTDIGNDVDDALAMGVIHALQNRDECELLAVTITKDNKYAAPVAELINTFYGRPDIPVGMVKDGVTKDDGSYLSQTYNTKNADGSPAFSTKITPENSGNCPDAVKLLRQVLAGQPDKSVVIIQVGFSTNLARLLDTKGDEYSPLSGKELLETKVSFCSVMAGAFVPRLAKHPEYNIANDIPAARKLFAESPCPIVFSGFEIGETIMYPPVSMQNEYNYVEHHPLKIAYQFYRGLENEQPTFDLTSVLYAVRPERDYFGLSEPVEVTVHDDATITFAPTENGRFRYMTVTPDQIAMVREVLTNLCSEPPKKR